MPQAIFEKYHGTFLSTKWWNLYPNEGLLSKNQWNTGVNGNYKIHNFKRGYSKQIPKFVVNLNLI